MLSGSDFSWFFPAKPIRWYWSSFVARVFLEVTDHPGRHHFQTPWALAMGRQAPRHSVSAGCTLNFKHPQQRWCHDKLRAPHHCPAISNIGYLGHERTPPGIASSWLTGFFRMLRKTRWSWQMTRNAVCNKRPSPSKRKTRKNAAEKNKRGKKRCECIQTATWISCWQNVEQYILVMKKQLWHNSQDGWAKAIPIMRV